jgi:hypothetical protein
MVCIGRRREEESLIIFGKLKKSSQEKFGKGSSRAAEARLLRVHPDGTVTRGGEGQAGCLCLTLFCLVDERSCEQPRDCCWECRALGSAVPAVHHADHVSHPQGPSLLSSWCPSLNAAPPPLPLADGSYHSLEGRVQRRRGAATAFSHKFSHLLPSPLSSLLDFKHKQSPRGGPPEGTLISPPLATHHDFKIRDGKVRGIPEKSTLKTIVRGRQSRSGRTGLGLGGRGGRNNPHPLCLPVCRAGEGSEL